MASTNSDQLALLTVAGNQYVDGNRDINAKRRIDYFSVLSTAAAADTINLVKLPKNARILGGRLSGQANTATATLSIGTDLALTSGSAGAVTIAAGAANLLAATAISSAYDTEFAATFALGRGAVCSNGITTIYGTVAGATLTGTAHITGWVEYAVN